MRAGMTLTLVLSLLLSTGARAQTATLSLESDEIYAGLPFGLAVTVEGLEPEPQPKEPSLFIDGCRVTFLGVSPNVSTSITIVNGRRSESRRVTFVYRYRVVAPTAGSYRVPAVTIEQGGARAVAAGGTIEVREIATTQDMLIEVNLPERAVWIGETFEATLDWLLRRDVSDQNFVVPLFEQEDRIVVRAPPDTKGEALRFAGAGRDLELPYERSSVRSGGLPYTRFRFRFLATPQKAGVLEVPGPQVVARIQSGTGHDRFGFPVARTQLFRAAGPPAKLEVRSLPIKDRPDSFSNAVGGGFSIRVEASRTVVRVGEPIELGITLRGDGSLEGVSLPSMDAAVGLPPEQFSVTDEPSAGELGDNGTQKEFTVTVRLLRADVREIPPLAFSYFDPEQGAYRTVRSEPIALSVRGSQRVDASDVVSGTPDKKTPVAAPSDPVPAPPGGGLSLVGADLSLSEESSTMRAALTPGTVRPVVAALYVLPLLLWGLRAWQVRTRERRGQAGAVRGALGRVERLLDEAAARPARQTAPEIVAALRALARESGRPVTGDVVERIETEGFAPEAAEIPLREGLVREAREMARSWARASLYSAPGSAARALLALLAVGASWRAHADEAPARLAEARAAYRDALETRERELRGQRFASAEAVFREIASVYPDRPELQADWGNAALGAHDLGRATLAYRRALHADPGLDRAHRNLAWVRKRAPDWLPRPASGGALGSLLYWHDRLPSATRQLGGAAAFALTVLLLIPWVPGRGRSVRRLSMLPAAVWMALVASVALERDASGDAVVTRDGVALRAADSAGAPAALAQPLPAGAEVTIIESRDAWARVALADGMRAWLPRNSIERVLR